MRVSEILGKKAVTEENKEREFLLGEMKVELD